MRIKYCPNCKDEFLIDGLSFFCSNCRMSFQDSWNAYWSAKNKTKEKAMKKLKKKERKIKRAIARESLIQKSRPLIQRRPRTNRSPNPNNVFKKYRPHVETVILRKTGHREEPV